MNEFTLHARPEKQAWLIELGGYLDAHTAPRLESMLQDLIEQGHHCIVVDFSDLNYISSAGLGVFMAYIEEVRENGGDIKLAAMSSKVFNVFDLLGFPLLYEIYEERNEAVEKFNERTIPG